MSNRPIHPTETAVPEAHWENDLAHVMYPATVVPDTETMRPLAADYQPPGQSTTVFGYDNDVPTKNWQPDSDYDSQRDKEPPVPIAALFPAIDVRLMPDGLVRTTFRTVIPANTVYSGIVGYPDLAVVRQLCSRNLNRKSMILKSCIAFTVGTLATTNAFVMAISADKYFADYMTVGFSGDTPNVELHGTDEMWATVIPMIPYDPTKINQWSLAIIEECVVTDDLPQRLGK